MQGPLCAWPYARGLLIKPYKSKDPHESIHTFPAVGTYSHPTFQEGCKVPSLPRDTPRERAHHLPDNVYGPPPACLKLLSSVGEVHTEIRCSQRGHCWHEGL